MMSYYISFDHVMNTSIPSGKLIKSNSLQLIRGFLTYAVNVNDMLIKHTSNVNVRYDDSSDISFIYHHFKIESIDNYDQERIDYNEWKNDRLTMKKVEYYNKYWKRYIYYRSELNSKRYIAYGRQSGCSNSSFVIYFDSIDFLKGFHLASVYHTGYSRLHIYQVHDRYQLCYQYITYNIAPDYSNIDKAVRNIGKYSSECYRVGYFETKKALMKYLSSDIIYHVLGYFLSKTCNGNNANDLYDYRHQFTHCLTLCDFGKCDLMLKCSVCSMGDNIDTTCSIYDKFPEIDIRLEIATDS